MPDHQKMYLTLFAATEELLEHDRPLFGNPFCLSGSKRG